MFRSLFDDDDSSSEEDEAATGTDCPFHRNNEQAKKGTPGYNFIPCSCAFCVVSNSNIGTQQGNGSSKKKKKRKKVQNNHTDKSPDMKKARLLVSPPQHSGSQPTQRSLEEKKLEQLPIGPEQSQDIILKNSSFTLAALQHLLSLLGHSGIPGDKEEAWKKLGKILRRPEKQSTPPTHPQTHTAASDATPATVRRPVGGKSQPQDPAEQFKNLQLQLDALTKRIEDLNAAHVPPMEQQTIPPTPKNAEPDSRKEFSPFIGSHSYTNLVMLINVPKKSPLSATHTARKQILQTLLCKLNLNKLVKAFSFNGNGTVELFVKNFDVEILRKTLSDVGFSFRDPLHIRYNKGMAEKTSPEKREKLATRLGFLLNRFKGRRLHHCILAGLTSEDKEACWKMAASFKHASQRRNEPTPSRDGSRRQPSMGGIPMDPLGRHRSKNKDNNMDVEN